MFRIQQMRLVLLAPVVLAALPSVTNRSHSLPSTTEFQSRVNLGIEHKCFHVYDDVFLSLPFQIMNREVFWK